MSDGGLRQVFQKHLAGIDWQSVETFSTGRGVPDLNGCADGVEFWVELKVTSGWAVDVRPEQIAWAERRLRHGGRVHLAVRRKNDGGPRLGDPVDELWLFPGVAMRAVSDRGLRLNADAVRPVGRYWSGGPGRWDWDDIKRRLVG